MWQVVILSLLDCSRDDAGGVVDESVNEKCVEILLDLDKHGLADLRSAVDVKDSRFVVKYPWILTSDRLHAKKATVFAFPANIYSCNVRI